MPPKIYKSLDKLKPKLRQYEPHIIQRRIGQNATIVFAVKYLKFKPEFPILDEAAFAAANSEDDDDYDNNANDIGNGNDITIDNDNDNDNVNDKGIENDIADDDGKGNDVDDDDDNGDRLVVTGPEEDEFRQYDDDDEGETVISRNLKKIRSDLPPLPLPPPPPPPKAPQQLQRPQTKALQPLPPKEPPRQEMPKEQEITVVDINKYLEEKNLRLLHAELNRHKEKFKKDPSARSTLKKAVFSCLERDETFWLVDLIKLVFEYDYQSDTEFWDELIGKLKRKDNPHAKCHSFKCQTDPLVVLRNYQLTTQDIVNYFDATNIRLALPWHTCRYLVEYSQRSTKPNASLTAEEQPQPIPALVAPEIPKATISLPAPEFPKQITGPVAQENLDPAELNRNVSSFYANGEQKFAVKIPKRQAIFNSKLLVT